MNTVYIAKRFCGPPHSGNGGYSCGVVANQTNYLTEVTLRKPPPLDKDLQVFLEADQVGLMDGETMIASAKPGTLELEVPAPLTFEQAVAAEKNFVAYGGNHVFPTCFVCGPLREKGDALHIFAGKVDGSDQYAASWIPDASLTNEDGLVAEEFLWAAMDCPGYFSLVGNKTISMVLGRMTAEIIKRPKAGEQCIVTAWSIGHEGKKHYSGTAVFNEQGELCSKAKAIWIDVVIADGMPV